MKIYFPPHCRFRAGGSRFFVKCFYSERYLSFRPYVSHRFARLLRNVAGGGIADGNDGSGIPFIRQTEKFPTKLYPEIAYPAGAQSLFGCGQAQMLDGDGYVDVGVVLVVVAARPGFVPVFTYQHIGRCFTEPVSVVALVQQSAVFVRSAEDEFPRLLVDSRRGQSRTFLDILQFVGRNAVRPIGTYGVACAAKIFEIHNQKFLVR